MRLRLLLAVMVVGTVTAVLLAPAAPGQDDLEAARADVAETTERLEELLDRLESTQRQGNELAGRYWIVESELQLLDQQVADTEQEQALLGEERDALMGEVRRVALDRYMARDLNMVWDDLETVADREAAEALAELFVGSDQATLDQLAVVDDEFTRTRARLEAQQLEQQSTLDEVVATQQGIEEELAELVRIRNAIEGELGELEAALDALEAAEAERLAAEERARLEEERRRAQEAAERAAAAAAAIPTPLPTAVPTSTPVPTATPVPNPQPSVPLNGGASDEGDTEATPVPNPQPSEPFPTATAVPNPQAAPTATPVPNPQPSEPFPTATAVPNPQAAPTATPVPNPQPSQPLPTATPVPNPQPAPSAGGIICPLAGPFTHTDDFNAPRAVGGVHRANDLIASTGTPVLAVASGTVEHRESRVGGLSAHLKGDNGDYYFYTHLNGYENVGAGWVAAGTVIGYVGMTGNAPIPHLHFEIHRGGYGNYTNPYGPVRTACGS